MGPGDAARGHGRTTLLNDPKARPRLLAAAAMSFAAAALLGAIGGLFRWDPHFAPGTLAAAVVFPAFGEELVFRRLLLPTPRTGVSTRQWVLQSAGALALFVLWHPAQAWFGAPWAGEAFLRTDFLVCAGCLGLGCTLLYAATGRLWPAVLAHWLAVALWKSLLGG